MVTLKGSFTIKIPTTKDLTPPDLECAWEAEFEGEPEYEKALLAFFKKSYESGLKKAMESQAKNFDVPLKSMQKDIDGMAKELETIKAVTTPAAAEKAMEAFKKKYPKTLAEQVLEYTEYLKAAVKNIKDQQMLVYGKKYEQEANEAARSAVKKELNAKKFRIVAGVVLKGVLALSVLAAGIAATVLTFGGAAVVFAVIGAVTVGVGGVSTLQKTGKSIYDIRNLEQRSLESLLSDLENVNGQLGKVEDKTTGLSKRFADVSLYYSQRRMETKALDSTLQEFQTNLTKLKTEYAKLASSMPKLVAAQGAKIAAAEKACSVAQAKFDASSARDAELKKALDDAQKVIGDLSKIPFGATKSVLSGLNKLKPKSADDVFAAIDQLNGLVAAGAGVAAGAA